MQASLWFTVPKVSYYSLHGSGSKQCFMSCSWISSLPRVVVIDTSKEDKKHCQSRLELRNMLSLQCFRRNALSIFTVHNGIHEEAAGAFRHYSWNESKRILCSRVYRYLCDTNQCQYGVELLLGQHARGCAVGWSPDLPQCLTGQTRWH